ncbi:hypothetical protein K435DRAFT_970187 [Dendrothele bispora CBS 962.96]|uniref:Uncharacterized protein n=1 Tax=Dendrothele bispora (strain CBS 962.96) TaxID=1314807 RepID=A0A4S8LCQ4_DENBC|nr:hypothetical protein K435DRAFT_970187 [Dendrothele bispora CBS 962.96]
MASLPEAVPSSIPREPKAKTKTNNTVEKKQPEDIITYYNTRSAGFPITFEVALEWANRILVQRKSKRLLTTAPTDRGNVLLTLDKAVKEAGGIECNFFGPPGPNGWEHYLLVMGEEVGNFYKINGEMPPGSELVDPEGEEIGKKLLAQEGIEHGPFTTCFYDF